MAQVSYNHLVESNWGKTLDQHVDKTQGDWQIQGTAEVDKLMPVSPNHL